MAEIIDRFSGDYEFLSNFCVAPMIIDNRDWLTVEHYFQAMKTTVVEEQELIRAAGKPQIAKAMGQARGTMLPGRSTLFQIRLRRDWDIFKLAVMYEALEAKFNQHPALMAKLVATHPKTLIEGNTWHDNIWGDCRCSRCIGIVGQNYLGKYLMEIRQNFINKIPDPPSR